MTASKMSVIDNDTMLKMEAVNENGTSVKLCFMKKGLSQKVINAIKHDFLNPNLRKRENRYNYSNISDRELSEDTSLEDVFYKNKELLGNMKLKGFEEDETYRIMPVYENDHFVTYLFEYVNVRGHGCDNGCDCVHVLQSNSNVRDDVPYFISIFDYYFCFTWQK